MPGQFRYYYLRLLETLKDDPVLAYQMIFVWSPEDILELVQILDYFVKAVALDFSYKAEAGKEHFLEKELIKSVLSLLNNPKACVSHLRQKIKTTISDNSTKLAIRVYEVASLNAARGLIKALGLDKGNVIILYDKEIDSGQAEKFFPEYDIRAFSELASIGAISIEFHDYGNMTINTSGGSVAASLPYVPFKFNLPERASEGELSKMREALGIGTRKVIVIGSPSDAEFNELIQSYNALYGNLPFAQRPLLIIGFRQRRNENELRFLGSLSGQSIAVRSDANAALPNVVSNNVLVLNTAGELIKMYALADVAIVGNDRNIFEPASQRAAVLYFEGSWQNNRDAQEALLETGAAQVFNKENLERLINAPDDARKMAERGLKAVIDYRAEVGSKAEEFALRIIGMTKGLRDKLLASSVSSPVTVSTIVLQLPSNQYSGASIPADRVGGIDFRFLPIVAQSMANLRLSIQGQSPAGTVPVERYTRINLKQEWSDIERLINSGITPSAERIKDYLVASSFKGNLDNDMDKIVSCISDLLRMEEESCFSTDPTLKDILVVLGSGRSGEELKVAFAGTVLKPIDSSSRRSLH